MNALISWAVQACRQYLPMYLPPFVSCCIDVGLNSALLSSPVLISHYQLDRGALKVDKQASGREVFEAVNQYNGLRSKLMSDRCFLPFQMWHYGVMGKYTMHPLSSGGSISAALFSRP